MIEMRQNASSQKRFISSLENCVFFIVRLVNVFLNWVIPLFQPFFVPSVEGRRVKTREKRPSTVRVCSSPVRLCRARPSERRDSDGEVLHDGTATPPCHAPLPRPLSPASSRSSEWRSAPLATGNVQGCQMVCFQTKNPNLGKFWKALEWKSLFFLWPFGIY
jgi:hypothetical protein